MICLYVRFVTEAPCIEILANKQRKERTLVLFNDLLMIVKEKRNKNVTNYKYHYHMPVLNLMIFDMEGACDITSRYSPRATVHLLLECDNSTPPDQCVEVIHPNYTRSPGSLSNVHHLFMFSSSIERSSFVKTAKQSIKEMIERREARDQLMSQ